MPTHPYRLTMTIDLIPDQYDAEPVAIAASILGDVDFRGELVSAAWDTSYREGAPCPKGCGFRLGLCDCDESLHPGGHLICMGSGADAGECDFPPVDVPSALDFVSNVLATWMTDVTDAPTALHEQAHLERRIQALRVEWAGLTGR